MLSLRLTHKLTAAFLALGLLPCAVLGMAALDQASRGLSQEAFSHLENLRTTKEIRLEALIARWRADLATALDLAELFSVPLDGAGADLYEHYLRRSLPPRGYHALIIADANGEPLLTIGASATGDRPSHTDDPRLRSVLTKARDTQAFAFADYSEQATAHPYPLAALPLVRDGQVTMIAAIAVSSAVIDAVMRPKQGIGATGEPYLVGPDHLMRSDSRLDPVNRSVRASFANLEKGRVDTVAVREALAGRAGTRLIVDYRGESVLSAFAPIRIGDVVWAVIVEQDEAEAFATVHRMRLMLAIVAVAALVAVLVGGLMMSRRMAHPIVSLTTAMNRLAAGDTMTSVPACDRRDEIGEMARAVMVFRENAIEIDRLQAGQALGDDLFDSVLAYLCRTLQMDGAFVGILDDKAMTTVSVRRDGETQPNISFACAASSCEATMRRGQLVALQNAARKFPADPVLEDWNAEAVVALALRDSRSQPFGVLAVLSRRPLAQKEPALALLRLFGARVAAELERKAYEDDLLETLRDLRAAQERTERAVREAKFADEAKTRFLAAASHDLRQPLQSLNLFAAALRNTEDGQKRRFLSDQIDVALAVMGNLLGSLLDISKLDAGLVVPEVQTIPVRELLGELAREFDPVLDEKGMRLKVVPCRCVIRSDRVLLANILRNLISNAIRYTPPGRKILLGCRPRDGAAVLSVTDTGRGIAADQLPLIFQEFYQVDNPARDRSQGLGLGLSIVKKLAELLGHRVVVSSRPGKGSTFAVVIPLSGMAFAAHDEREQQEGGPPTGVAEETGDGHGVDVPSMT